jgi:hypothetical protein
VHDPGKTVLDLTIAVASDPFISRQIRRMAADAPAALKALRAARPGARQQAWALAGRVAPGSGGGLITADIDTMLATAHSDKQAVPTWKRKFGFHPPTVFADHGADGSGEPLATMLRTGNAGSNTAADHITATKLALAQLPKQARRRVLVRANSGGGTHEFLDWPTAPSRRLAYPVGFTVTDEAQQAIMQIPARAWTPAYDGGRRLPGGSGCRHDLGFLLGSGLWSRWRGIRRGQEDQGEDAARYGDAS